MNFDFSEEQLSLKEEARRFLNSLAPLEGTRTLLAQRGQTRDERVWKGVVAQGWTGAVIPEEYGGLELSYLELCVLAEELGYSLAAIPFASSIYLFAELLILAGSEEQKQKLLPRIADGSAVGTVAFSEGPGGLGIGSLSTLFAGGELRGHKLPVFDATAASHCIVLATSSDGPSLYLVEMQGEGVVIETVETIDPSRECVALTLRGASASPLGEPGQGIVLLEQVLDRAAVLFAFEQVGAADRCLEMATAYVNERYAFGRRIGSYQAIKHKLADVYVKNQLARSSAYFGAWALNGNEAQLSVAASAARIAACDALWQASTENIQVHGGIGYTWESDCHLFFRRGKHLALVIGAAPHWKERLVAGLQNEEAIDGLPR